MKSVKLFLLTMFIVCFANANAQYIFSEEMPYDSPGFSSRLLDSIQSITQNLYEKNKVKEIIVRDRRNNIVRKINYTRNGKINSFTDFNDDGTIKSTNEFTYNSEEKISGYKFTYFKTPEDLEKESYLIHQNFSIEYNYKNGILWKTIDSSEDDYRIVEEAVYRSGTLENIRRYYLNEYNDAQVLRYEKIGNSKTLYDEDGSLYARIIEIKDTVKIFSKIFPDMPNITIIKDNKIIYSGMNFISTSYYYNSLGLPDYYIEKDIFGYEDKFVSEIFYYDK